MQRVFSAMRWLVVLLKYVYIMIIYKLILINFRLILIWNVLLMEMKWFWMYVHFIFLAYAYIEFSIVPDNFQNLNNTITEVYISKQLILLTFRTFSEHRMF